MHSQLQFFDHDTNTPSDCGDVLNIKVSSAGLDWPGIIVEKGESPYFYPQNVYTPYFYFALALEQDLNWRVITEQGETPLKSTPGNIWINPPQTPFTHNIDEPCFFVILAVEQQTFLQTCPLPINRMKLQYLNNYNVVDESIKGIIELFLLEAHAKGRNGKTYLQNLLSLLSTQYIQNYSNYFDLLERQESQSKFDQNQVDKIDAYIDQYIGKTITVEELAETLSCSKFYFLREFKKFVGETPYQYLMKKRLFEAKRRLQNQPQIAQIAYELGFNDQAHFTRNFKNQFQLTPGQFLKNIENTEQ